MTSFVLVDSFSREDSSVIFSDSTEHTEFSISENWQLLVPLGTESHREIEQEEVILLGFVETYVARLSWIYRCTSKHRVRISGSSGH